MTTLAIAGDRCRIEGPPVLEAALATRYAGFVVASETGDPTLRVSLADRFVGDYAAPARLAVLLDGNELRFEGEATGAINLERGGGSLSGVADLGPVDAALRAWLTTRAPARGVLPLHGMIAPVHGGALVLVGESGAGKSTAARELGAVCDEMVAITAAGTAAHATPYWGGRPYAAPLVAIGVLTRDGEQRAGLTRLRGSAAMRLIAPHVVRYVAHPAAERAMLALLAELAERSVWRLDAPVGADFPAFVTRAAAELALAPRTDRIERMKEAS